MTKNVISIDEGITAQEAAKIMTEKRISSLIVERENWPGDIYYGFKFLLWPGMGKDQA